MSYLNKSTLLRKAKEREYMDVRVPDGSVMIQSLTSAERDRFEMESVEMDGKATKLKDNIRARAVVMSVVDPSSKERMFSDLDIREVGSMRSSFTDAIYKAFQELNGLTEEDVDEMVKASEVVHSADSGSE